MSVMDLIKAEILKQMEHDNGIYSPTLYEFAKKHRIPRTVVTAALADTLGYLENVPYTRRKNPRGQYPSTQGANGLGCIQFDFFYLVKPIGRLVFGALVFVDILSKRIWTERIYHDKSAVNMLDGIKRFLKSYRRDMKGHYPYLLMSDRERSFTSRLIREYLVDKQKIQLVFFKRPNKAFLAERMILSIKRLFLAKNFQYVHYKSQIPSLTPIRDMDLELSKLTKELNARPIVCLNKVTPFKHDEINYENQNTLIDYLDRIDPIRVAENFVFRDDVYPFKYAIGDKVKAIRKSHTFDKRSQQTLEETIYEVIKRFLFLARNVELSAAYLVTPQFSRDPRSPNQLLFLESELVKFKTVWLHHYRRLPKDGLRQRDY